jgi:hypothetical protein
MTPFELDASSSTIIDIPEGLISRVKTAKRFVICLCRGSLWNVLCMLCSSPVSWRMRRRSQR